MPTAQQRKLARLAKALPGVSDATRRKALPVLADADEAEDGADLEDVRVQKELLDLCLTELTRQKVKIDFYERLTTTWRIVARAAIARGRPARSAPAPR
jgi:hypothetical protein